VSITLKLCSFWKAENFVCPLCYVYCSLFIYFNVIVQLHNDIFIISRSLFIIYVILSKKKNHNCDFIYFIYLLYVLGGNRLL